MNWTTVNIPTSLLDEVKSVIKKHPLWINEPEFIRDAVREKIVSVKSSLNATIGDSR